MSKYIVDENTMKGIANSIRTADGSSATILGKDLAGKVGGLNVRKWCLRDIVGEKVYIGPYKFWVIGTDQSYYGGNMLLWCAESMGDIDTGGFGGNWASDIPSNVLSIVKESVAVFSTHSSDAIYIAKFMPPAIGELTSTSSIDPADRGYFKFVSKCKLFDNASNYKPGGSGFFGVRDYWYHSDGGRRLMLSHSYNSASNISSSAAVPYRPICTLDPDQLVSLTPDSNGIYSLVLTVPQSASIAPLSSASPASAGTMEIYVPDSQVDEYKSATNWNLYADDIHPVSSYPIQEG